MESDDNKVSEAEALSLMKETPGWKLLEEWIKTSRDLSIDRIFKSDKTQKWDDFVHYRATANAYSKVLALVDQKISLGVTAKKRQEAEKANGS